MTYVITYAPLVTGLLATASFAYAMLTFNDEMLFSNSNATVSNRCSMSSPNRRFRRTQQTKFRSQVTIQDGVHSQRSAEIEFDFMGLKLTDVAQDLNAEWDFRFLSWLVAAALNQKNLLCSSSRRLEHRLQLVEEDAHSRQSCA